MEQQKIEFKRYRDFGQIINATFEFIKQNFGPLLKSLVFIVGPFLLITGIISGFYQKNVFSFNNLASLSSIGVSMFFLIISAFFTVQMMLSTVYSFVQIYLERTEFIPVHIEEVWEGVKKNFLKILGMTFSLGLMGIIALILFGVITVVTINSGNPFLVFFIFILFSIPVVFFLIKITLVYIISIYEGKGVIESIQRSFYLTKNRWWFTLGLMLVLSLIQGFMGFIFQLPEYIVMLVSMFNSMDGSTVDGVTEVIILATSIISTVQYLMYAISFIAVAFYYFSLVEQKEAKGLLEKIESI